MAKQPEHDGSKGRVIPRRARVTAEGLQRVEITVPADDAELVKVVAAACP